MGHQLLFSIMVAVTATFALFAGGKPEKLCAIAFVTAGLWTIAVHAPLPQRYARPELGVLIVDGALLVSLLAIALQYDRFWPLWMVALQAMGVAAHLSKIVGLPLLPLAYQRALVFWSYPMVPLLAVATWRHRGRRMHTGQPIPNTVTRVRRFSANFSERLALMVRKPARRR